MVDSTDRCLVFSYENGVRLLRYLVFRLEHYFCFFPSFLPFSRLQHFRANISSAAQVFTFDLYVSSPLFQFSESVA